jgi:transposase-like protein
VAKRKTGKTKKSGSGGTAEKPEQQVRRRHPAGLRQQAVERMELGGNVSELAREFGVHRNLLYYWRDRRKGDPAHAAAKLDPETVKVRELEGRIASLEGSWDGRHWNWIFSPVPCSESRADARAARPLARQRLHRNPGQSAGGGSWIERLRDVRVGGCEPGQFLPALGGGGAE